MRPRTVSFASTETPSTRGRQSEMSDNVNNFDGDHLISLNLLSRSQPTLPLNNNSNNSNNNNKTNRELTAIGARLTKLQDRVQQTLSGSTNHVLVPRPRPRRAQTSNGWSERTSSVVISPTQQKQNQRQHHRRQKKQRKPQGGRIGSTIGTVPLITVDPVSNKNFAVTEPIVSLPPPTQMFHDERLQNYAEQYDREVTNFASVALHAEVRLKQLDLMGDVPNKLALAVSLDVLRRLGAVSGRYEDIMRRVHNALLPHCYLGYQNKKNNNNGNNQSSAHRGENPSTPERYTNSRSNNNSPILGTAIPERLVDYLQQKPTFLHVETVDRENINMNKKMEKLRSDRMSSISMLSDGQKAKLVWDALHAKDPFEASHMKSAIDRDRTKALKAFWTYFRDESDPNITSQRLRTLLHNARFAAKLDVDTWDPIASNQYRDAVVKGLFNLHGSAPQDANNTFELDEVMYSWLLKPQNKDICSDLVMKLQENVDEDRVVVTVTPKDAKQSKDNKRKALETFLLGANDEDVNMLRTMVLTWDYQNGVEWKLQTKGSEAAEEEKTVIDAQKAAADQAKAIDAAILEDRQRREAEKQSLLASKAIFAFKTNVQGKVAQKMADRAKKAKLKKMMSKFRTTALICVRGPLAGNLKFEPSGPIDQGTQIAGDDIDKEMSALMRRLGQQEAKMRQKQWSKVLEGELNKAANYKGSKKGKKMVIDHNALPAAFGSQITSFRMAYKDIKRFKTKSIPALVRLSFEVYAKHCELHRMDHKSKKHAKKKYSPDKIFSGTLYAHFLERYGLPEIADANMVGLAAALVSNRHEDPRLDAFAKFCFGELNEHVATGYTIGITMLAESSISEQQALAKLRPGGEIKPLSLSPSSPKNKKKKSSRRSSSHKSKSSDDSIVEIPTEDWWCSISSVKGAMSKALGTTRKDTWLSFISEIEAAATLVDIKRLEDESSTAAEDNTTTSSPTSKNSRSRKSNKASSSNSPGKSPRKKDRSLSSGVGAKGGLAKLRQVAKSTVKIRRLKAKDSHSYKVGSDDFRNIIKADTVLSTFLQYWSDDLHAKEEHLAELFKAADVDGDGELTTSEFTSLIHSVDPEVPVSEVIKMYKNALHKTGTECLDPLVFVNMCHRSGLVHRAWDRHNGMYDIANTNSDLRQAWEVAQPFVLGTLRALERDLPENHPLRTGTEAGDGSLVDIKMQLDNMKKFAASEETTKMAWHSYWMLLKHVGEAASEGPGVQTIYGNDVPGTRRLNEDAPELVPRSIKDTPHKERRRRNALPFIMFPDPERVCGTTAPWGPSGGGRRGDYIIPLKVRLVNLDE